MVISELALFQHWEPINDIADIYIGSAALRIRIEAAFFSPDRTAFLDRLLERQSRQRYSLVVRRQMRRQRLLGLTGCDALAGHVVNLGEFQRCLLTDYWYRHHFRFGSPAHAASQRYLRYTHGFEMHFRSFAGLLDGP